MALVATIRTASGLASAISSAYSRSAPIVRSSAACDSRPVRSTPSPSRTIRISRTRSVSGGAAGAAAALEPRDRSESAAFDWRSAISRRIEFVPQSTAATRCVIRPPRRRVTHGPRDHHGPAASSASRPNGFVPGAASSCATSACRHLTRSGIPPADWVPGGSGSTPASAAAASRRAR